MIEAEINKEERSLAKTLIGALQKKDFDFSEYRDMYTERLTQLIELKVEGKEIVSPPAVEEREIINLMDALKESVNRVATPPKRKKPAASKKKPARKMASSSTQRSTAKKTAKKKKTG